MFSNSNEQPIVNNNKTATSCMYLRVDFPLLVQGWLFG